MTRDIGTYISGLEHMAASPEADARWNWPDIPIDEIPDGHSCMAREEPKIGTVRNRISFFREIAAILKGLIDSRDVSDAQDDKEGYLMPDDIAHEGDQ